MLYPLISHQFNFLWKQYNITMPALETCHNKSRTPLPGGLTRVQHATARTRPDRCCYRNYFFFQFVNTQFIIFLFSLYNNCVIRYWRVIEFRRWDSLIKGTVHTVTAASYVHMSFWSQFFIFNLEPTDPAAGLWLIYETVIAAPTLFKTARMRLRGVSVTVLMWTVFLAGIKP